MVGNLEKEQSVQEMKKREEKKCMLPRLLGYDAAVTYGDLVGIHGIRYVLGVTVYIVGGRMVLMYFWF